MCVPGTPQLDHLREASAICEGPVRRSFRNAADPARDASAVGLTACPATPRPGTAEPMLLIHSH